MSIVEMGQRARKRFRRTPFARPSAHIRDDSAFDIEATQRYRTMIGYEQPLAERTAHARKNAAATTELSHKTW